MSYDEAMTKVQKVCELQRCILQLDRTNLAQTAKQISEFDVNEKQIRANIYSIGKAKTLNIPMYCDLLAEIMKNTNKFKKLASDFYHKKLLINNGKEVPLISFPFIRALYDSNCMEY